MLQFFTFFQFLNVTQNLEKVMDRVSVETIPPFYDVGKDFEWNKDAFPVLQFYYPSVLLLGNIYLFTVMIYSQYWYNPQFKNQAPHKIVKNISRIWNLIWCVFSVCGFLGSIPYLHMITSNEENKKGSLYFWIFLYIFTKPLEIIDTLLLMINGREVRLIHWSHHNITMIYTWFISLRFNNLAILFAIVNLGVHGVMYAYYFFMSFECWKKCLYNISFLVTSIQITQFILCIGYSFYYRSQISNDLFWLTCTMYFYYFVMFVQLYRERAHERSKKIKLNSR
jgi:hypothetical protein